MSGIGDDAGGSAAKRYRGRRLEITRSALFGTTLSRIGFGLLVVIVLFCFLGPHIYPTDQITTNIEAVLDPPSRGYPVGTDPNGYDELGRLMIGGQAALKIGLLSALLATVFGALYGAIAGFFGGFPDALMMRVVDTLLSVPGLLILFVLVSIYRPTFTLLVIAISMFAWLVPARLVRGETLTLKVREFVQAARMMGATNTRLIWRHVLPNVLGTITVNAAFQVADSILAISALSFLGLGEAPPATDWGTMLDDGVSYQATGAWWLIYPVGGLIILTILAFNLVGEGVEQALADHR
ncbi:MAG: peptide transporter permease [Frankiales bacterium]|nr:peptide transporter permease [Frankiales bacterium]